MKTIFLVCAALCAALIPLSATPTARAQAAGTTYALVTAANTPLLREAREAGIDNTYFILPATYFVLVIQTDYAVGYHKVRYRDVVGYVASENVEIKDYTPKSIFPPDVTLSICIDSSDVNVRSLPDRNTGKVLYRLPADSTGVEYYNYIPGVAADGINNVWYYVKIELGSDSVVKGYVYAPYVLLDSEIPPENDTTAAVVPPDTVPEPSPVEKADLPDAVEIVGIVALCVPAVLIVIVIFARPRRKNKDVKQKYSS